MEFFYCTLFNWGAPDVHDLFVWSKSQGSTYLDKQNETERC
jgi:hypothetical protein